MIPLAKKKILLIEDNKNIADSISDFLILNGLECTHAENGLLGIIELEKKKFDLIILDILMPVLDGVEVIKYIFSKKLIVPTIVLTASNTDQSELFYNYGIINYMNKPFKNETLLTHIRNTLRISSTTLPEFASELKKSLSESSDDVLSEKIYKVIYDNVFNSQLNTGFVAHELSMSRRTLLRKCNENYNLGVHELIERIRFEQLFFLKSNNLIEFKDAARLMGYSSEHYLINKFNDYLINKRKLED